MISKKELKQIKESKALQARLKNMFDNNDIAIDIIDNFDEKGISAMCAILDLFICNVIDQKDCIELLNKYKEKILDKVY